jgi:capsular exopolysaccharide synthesis family protein
MSRVDKALRAWEESAGGNSYDDEGGHSVRGTPLSEYAREAEALTRLPAQPQAIPVRVAAQPPGDPESRARLVTGGAKPIVVEQYRRIAATLHDAQLDTGLKTVMLTSAVPDEGKTLTTLNLALTLTDSFARRVLIVDADLRWPSMHSFFHVGNTGGLTDALADDSLALPLVPVSERLSLLTAGRPGPMPLAGLSSPRMAALLDECGRGFDWVLLDTPPVGLLPDAQLLARLAGAVILVIAAGATPAATIERTIAELGPERIIGTVLNRVDRHAIADADYYAQYARGR